MTLKPSQMLKRKKNVLLPPYLEKSIFLFFFSPSYEGVRERAAVWPLVTSYCSRQRSGWKGNDVTDWRRKKNGLGVTGSGYRAEIWERRRWWLGVYCIKHLDCFSSKRAQCTVGFKVMLFNVIQICLLAHDPKRPHNLKAQFYIHIQMFIFQCSNLLRLFINRQQRFCFFYLSRKNTFFWGRNW